MSNTKVFAMQRWLASQPAGQTELNTQIHIDQNAKSQLYILLKTHHSGREPENYDTHMDQKAKQKISKCRNLPHWDTEPHVTEFAFNSKKCVNLSSWMLYNVASAYFIIWLEIPVLVEWAWNTNNYLPSVKHIKFHIYISRASIYHLSLKFNFNIPQC